MPLEPRVVKDSFARLESSEEKAAAYFYGRLFAANPRLRALFPPAMDMQRDRLFRALTKIVWSLDNPEALSGYLSQLGRDHRKFGVTPEHYAAIGSALIATLRKFSGDTWTLAAEEAWTTAYATAAATMIDAAEAAAEQSPPWWVGEVLAHERRTHDIAVVTLRPHHRLPYTAGQYVTVQTARWPRVWRPFSVANAPHPDGTLRLHVRAVPAGWVSGALVRHTAVGDSLLLGPALGSLTLDPGSDRELLLVAGGTGLAPLKALVEQLAESGRPRPTLLVMGARTEAELYDLPALRDLEAFNPWLRVLPVVSGDPSYAGQRGLVSEVLDQIGDLADRDAYVAGPAEMIMCTVQKLHDLGMPPGQIHHDSLTLDGEPGGMLIEQSPPAPLGYIPP
jgi:NAD(P)H-flavin reductase/hemoglobin-like flavoprotein